LTWIKHSKHRLLLFLGTVSLDRNHGDFELYVLLWVLKYISSVEAAGIDWVSNLYAYDPYGHESSTQSIGGNYLQVQYYSTGFIGILSSVCCSESSSISRVSKLPVSIELVFYMHMIHIDMNQALKASAATICRCSTQSDFELHVLLWVLKYISSVEAAGIDWVSILYAYDPYGHESSTQSIGGNYLQVQYYSTGFIVILSSMCCSGSSSISRVSKLPVSIELVFYMHMIHMDMNQVLKASAATICRCSITRQDS
jgi:uncharacterized membrane protein